MSHADIKIFDIPGRILSNPEKHHNDLYVGNLKQGIYIIQIQVGDMKYVEKFMKK